MEYISSKYVKTRKPHQCWGCGETHPKGTTMERVVSKDMGEISAVYWCPLCVAKMATMDRDDVQDGFPFGELGSEYQYCACTSRAGLINFAGGFFKCQVCGSLIPPPGHKSERLDDDDKLVW